MIVIPLNLILLWRTVSYTRVSQKARTPFSKKGHRESRFVSCHKAKTQTRLVSFLMKKELFFFPCNTLQCYVSIFYCSSVKIYWQVLSLQVGRYPPFLHNQ